MPSPPAPEPVRDASTRRPAAALAAAALVAAVFAAVCATLFAPVAAGQPVLRNDEDLDFDRPEAWAMKYFTSVSLMSGFGVPEARRPGAVEVDVELGWIPEIDDDEARVGFSGSKVEDVNKAPVFLRPRLVVGLPRDVSLSVGYVPPVEAFDAEAHVLSLSLDRPLGRLGGWRFGGRLYGQLGEVESDITCPNEVVGVDDPALNPTGCEEESRDRVTMNYAGVELSAAWGSPEARWQPYAALAANHLDMEFQVDALTNGLRDLSRLTADGWTWSAAAGVRWRGDGGLGLAVEAYYTPLEVDRELDGRSENDALFHVRTLVSWRPE